MCTAPLMRTWVALRATWPHLAEVRFAQDHLGYICSPQNIQRFMGHYDCIMEQEALGKGNCRRHIMGEAIPGKDEKYAVSSLYTTVTYSSDKE
ncbi:hypothetical protein ANCDUO_11428 [Ancylostoma duodenale]|uniref:Uncharacterized protein n=1 Tax=Ancylostoma duodenale TaxID=51022 RepID=A0A0C2GN34_9BILA|nr:hypothetical protein ANCDUO_11428 [Ancylostoma duodenale]